MGYYDDDRGTEGVAHSPGLDGIGIAQQVLILCARIIGLGLLLVGLAVGVGVILEAWSLYKEPRHIERFAEAVEQGSNLDAVLRDVVGPGGNSDTARADAQSAAGHSGGGLRLSYFVAWAVALVLLLVVGMLAMSAVTTGGRLALYDSKDRRVANAAVAEVRRMGRGG